MTDEHELRHAAQTLVTTALRISPRERFVAVGDLESLPLLEALERAARDAGADATSLRLDLLRSHSTNHSGMRPHRVLPDGIRRAMLSAQASVFVASAPHDERSMREQLVQVVAACRIRHAHMPNIRPAAFASGLATSFEHLAEVGARVEARLDDAAELFTESPTGTRLTVKFDRHAWVKQVGRIGPGEAVSFPAGSLVVSPESVSGTFAASASVGGFFGEREGLLREPVIFEIEDGHVVAVRCPGNPSLVNDIEQMLHVAPNSERVGLAIVGFNEGIGDATGDVTVDKHRPGLHLVFGDPARAITGAEWTARTSFAACQAASTVAIDGTLLVERNALLVA